MPRGVPRATQPDIIVNEVEETRHPGPGSWGDQPQGEAAEQARTGARLVDPPGTAEPDRVADALLKHLAALNSKARQVGAGRDDLFIAESFRELTEAIIEERRR